MQRIHMHSYLGQVGSLTVVKNHGIITCSLAAPQQKVISMQLL